MWGAALLILPSARLRAALSCALCLAPLALPGSLRGESERAGGFSWPFPTSLPAKKSSPSLASAWNWLLLVVFFLFLPEGVQKLTADLYSKQQARLQLSAAGPSLQSQPGARPCSNWKGFLGVAVALPPAAPHFSLNGTPVLAVCCCSL